MTRPRALTHLEPNMALLHALQRACTILRLCSRETWLMPTAAAP